MNLQEIPLLLRNHFEQTSDVLCGKLRVRGTRVSVEQVLELLEAGVSPAEIVQSFPSLSEQDVIAAEQLAAHCALTKWITTKKELQFFPLTQDKPNNH